MDIRSAFKIKKATRKQRKYKQAALSFKSTRARDDRGPPGTRMSTCGGPVNCEDRPPRGRIRTTVRAGVVGRPSEPIALSVDAGMSDSDDEWSRAKAPSGGLDPDEVLSLALSMAPRCRQIHPPPTTPSKQPTSPTSFFHAGMTLLQQTFSTDAEETTVVLSFIVDDECSLARVDVYSESGTVMTCRVVEAPDEAAGAAVRRLVRRRCNIGALRRILEDPPSITQIDPGIVSVDASQSTREPSPLRINRTRLMKHQSKLDSAQSLFIKEQEKKYLKRLRKDERMRQCVGNAILEGGIVDIQSSPSNESQPTPTNSSSKAGDDLPSSDIYEKQKAIQDSIEFADMGIAILYGEAERLKKMMNQIKREKEKHNPTAENERSLDAGDEKSLSTDHSTEDGSSSSGTDSVMSEMARVLQGCEVEYSFNHEYHDVLEAALLGDDDSSDESSAEETKTVRKLQRRGRSRPPSAFAGYSKKMSSSGKKSATSYTRQDEMSPITAIPTNGQGCVILREDGSFDTIGKIPDLLEQRLFPKKGRSVVPEQIFLGTKDRHFVRFRDGQFVFYGPPDLAKVLNQNNKNRQRRGKNRNRGKRDKMQQARVTSLAFGKAIDDFFLVRSDGSWHSNGNLPEGLEDLLDKRNDNIDLEFVSIGPDNEWAVKDKSGRIYWGGVSEEVDERLGEILDYSDVFWIDFGLQESYFLLHK